MNLLTNLEIDEVSFVDAGANPEANVTIFKRDEAKSESKSETFDELTALVKMGYPVLVWSTMNLEDPQLTGISDGNAEWYSNEHCVVLYALNGNDALVSDPLEGLVTRDASRFAAVYEQCGKHALAIY